MSWSLGPPIFGKEQIPVLLKKRKSASEFFGIVSSDAGRAWRKPSVYVIFQDEGALCEAPAPGCTGDGVSSRRKAKRFPAIRSGPGRGDVQNGKRQGNSGGSVKKLRFQQSFSRHGVARASAALFIWLNENVRFQQSFSRHGIARASAALPIWLNENVEFLSSISRLGNSSKFDCTRLNEMVCLLAAVFRPDISPNNFGSALEVPQIHAVHLPCGILHTTGAWRRTAAGLISQSPRSPPRRGDSRRPAAREWSPTVPCCSR